jgi:imidazolonepropionase-like amidohydrolase
MRKASPVQALAFLFVFIACHPGTSVRRPLAFTHVTVIDGTGAPAKPNLTVIVTGDRITDMGEANVVPVPKAAEVVNGSGKFLIPGLCDMHVHGATTETFGVPTDSMYRLYLANGVTCVRDMWGPLDANTFRKGLAESHVEAPHLYLASPIVDGSPPVWPGSIAVSTPEEARKVVDQQKHNGAEFIKVYNNLSRGEYFAIINESRRQHIPVVGHVPTAITAWEASAAGQRSIEHLMGIPLAVSRRENELRSRWLAAKSHQTQNLIMLEALHAYDARKAQRLFSEFIKNGTWQVPTLTVLHSIGMLNNPQFTNDPRLRYVSRTLRDAWNPQNDFRLRAWTQADFARMRVLFGYDERIVGAMFHAGVPILAGTDVLNPYCFPGFSLHDELRLLVESGLPPMAALQTATRNPARFLGREAHAGTVEKGKIADLLLLDANPLDDIRNTTKIAGVVLAGRYFRRASLNNMLAEAEKMAARKSVADALWKTIQDKGVSAGLEQYQRLKATESGAYDFGEDELNGLGYRLIGVKKIKEAIEVLKVNVEAYPISANVYDSLGEAYVDDGDTGLAVKNYRKSLELNPWNKKTLERLKQLGSPQSTDVNH